MIIWYSDCLVYLSSFAWISMCLTSKDTVCLLNWTNSSLCSPSWVAVPAVRLRNTSSPSTMAMVIPRSFSSTVAARAKISSTSGRASLLLPSLLTSWVLTRLEPRPQDLWSCLSTIQFPSRPQTPSASAPSLPSGWLQWTPTACLAPARPCSLPMEKSLQSGSRMSCPGAGWGCWSTTQARLSPWVQRLITKPCSSWSSKLLEVLSGGQTLLRSLTWM